MQVSKPAYFSTYCNITCQKKLKMQITFAIIILTTLTSLIAFPGNVRSIDSIRKPEWFDKFKFNALAVFKYKQIYRIISYGFIHADWMHLLFNMLTLYFFGKVVEDGFAQLFPGFGGLVYVGFYILALVVSSLQDLITHRNHAYYNAVGASGAVSAVLYSAILFYPDMKLYFILIPIPITAWIFGILYLIYSFYMARKKIDNIGHTAHFWGAVFGFVFPILFYPQLIVMFFKALF